MMNFFQDMKNSSHYLKVFIYFKQFLIFHFIGEIPNSIDLLKAIVVQQMLSITDSKGSQFIIYDFLSEEFGHSTDK